MDDETRKLAALAHRIWARWMRAMFAHGEHHDNGTWTMDQHAYRRWTRQMETDFDDLHEGERFSDIEVAHEWLEATGVAALRAENARLREALDSVLFHTGAKCPICDACPQYLDDDAPAVTHAPDCEAAVESAQAAD